ncbi:MAG: HAMP domain-containing histidine kinase [Candidatus Sericytochromatia bacterium]|nr:HAMP domain-containing histidine kinase [Candidatus Tanganyikabacteria bacterium]
MRFRLAMAAVALLGPAAVLGLVSGLEAQQQSEARTERGQMIRQVTGLLERYLERRFAAIGSVSALFETTPPDRALEAFPAFAGRLSAGVTGFQSLLWLDDSLEVRAARPAPGSPGTGATLLGPDLLKVAQAALQARRVMTSDEVRTADGAPAIFAFDPAYRDGRLAGLAVGILKPVDILADALSPDLRSGVAIRVFGRSGRLLYQSANSYGQVETRAPVAVADLGWTLALELPPRGSSPWSARLVWALGLVCFVLAEFWMWREGKRIASLEAAVAARTASLAATVDRLRTLLSLGGNLQAARTEREIGRQVTQAAVDLVGTDCSALFIQVPAGMEVRASASRGGYAPLPEGMNVPRAGFPFAHAALAQGRAHSWVRGQAMEMTDAEKRWVDEQQVGFYHCAPVGSPPRGLLVLAAREEPPDFDTAGSDIVEILAGQAALALATVRQAVAVPAGGDAIPPRGAGRRDGGQGTDGADWLGSSLEDQAEAAGASSGTLSVSLEAGRIGRVVEHVFAQMIEAAPTAQARTHLAAVPKDLPPVWTDKRRLAQVLRCLLGNALQSRGGAIAVGVGLRSGGREVDIQVKDSGTLIPEAELSRVFDRADSASGGPGRNGTDSGIGLFLAQRLLAEMGGEITATSSENTGTTFTVTLLVARE